MNKGIWGLWLSLFGFKALKLHFVKGIWGHNALFRSADNKMSEVVQELLSCFVFMSTSKTFWRTWEQMTGFFCCFFFSFRWLFLYSDVFCQHVQSRFHGKHEKNVTFWTAIKRRLTAEALFAVQNVLLIFQHQWETRLDIINVMRRYQKMTLRSIFE